MKCGKCGAFHDRVGQRRCKTCNAEYMRKWRLKQNQQQTEEPATTRKWDYGLLLKAFGYPSKET